MTTVSETLNTATDLLQERGWTKGEGWDWDADGTRPLCLAIGVAAGITEANGFEPFNECPAGRAVRAYLNMTPTPDPWGTWGTLPNLASSALYRWNDQVPTSAAEVIEVLRAAAVIEAARENESAAVEVGA